MSKKGKSPECIKKMRIIPGNIIKKLDIIRIMNCNNAVINFSTNKAGFGMNEILGIAAGIIIAALIIVPGLKSLAGSIMNKLINWWSTMESGFFSINTP